jgi:hypothetical protein
MNGTIGMKATINASSVQGNTEVGIMNSVGTIGNERIKAIAFVKQNDSGKKYIGWAVKAKDLTSGVQRQLAAGVFGEWDKTWTTGKNITVMFKRIGNEIQFNVQGYPSTVKWKPKSSMNSLDWSPEIWAWAANGNNKVKATIKSVYIIYP